MHLLLPPERGRHRTNWNLRPDRTLQTVAGRNGCSDRGPTPAVHQLTQPGPLLLRASIFTGSFPRVWSCPGPFSECHIPLRLPPPAAFFAIVREPSFQVPWHLAKAQAAAGCASEMKGMASREGVKGWATALQGGPPRRELDIRATQ